MKFGLGKIVKLPKMGTGLNMKKMAGFSAKDFALTGSMPIRKRRSAKQTIKISIKNT